MFKATQHTVVPQLTVTVGSQLSVKYLNYTSVLYFILLQKPMVKYE